MRRLYPQILKAEQSIQELHVELKCVESESKDQRGELNEADHEIQDLRSALGLAEQHQAQLIHDLGQLGLEGKHLRSEWDEAEQEERELSMELHSYWSENQMERKLLDQASQLRRQQQGEISGDEGTIDLCLEQLADKGEELRRFDEEFQEASGVSHCLECELDGAQFESRKQRKYLARVEEECSRQFSTNASSSLENSHFARQVESLEQCRQALADRLEELEAAKKEGDEITGSLAKSTKEKAALGLQLAGISQKVRERQDELDDSQREQGKLRSSLEQSEAKAEEMRTIKLKREEDHQLREEAECEGKKQQQREISEELAHAEAVHETEAHELGSEAEAADQQRRGLREKVSSLKSQGQSLRERLAGLESEAKGLTGRISALEGDSTTLGTQNIELEDTITKAKKTPNCTVA